MQDKIPQLTLPRKTILGVQFLFVAFGATVLVPLLVGISPSIALLTAGVGTLLFHLITRGKVPVFLGSSNRCRFKPDITPQVKTCENEEIRVGIIDVSNLGNRSGGFRSANFSASGGFFVTKWHSRTTNNIS